ncbi:MAG: DUF1566 domain-containing protein [Acidobacteria bacterium]|nr:DUF1566 domain-containing protein [Acidobacteriota bacterium]
MNGGKSKENYRKALELYYESAEKGHAYSQLQLGKMFLLGKGVDPDYKAALEWLRRSVDQGNGEAQAYLGEMYEKGLGVERNIPRALELYKKSAAESNALGQARLAGLYLAGLGVEENPRVAFVWYEKSADQGNDEAQASLGRMYEKGLGVNRDIRRAAELYRKSADQENAFGQLRLGDFYLNGLAVEKNPRRAFIWYSRAAAQEGDPKSAAQAQLRLGAMYCQGNGVDKDLKKGFEFYERAARMGNEEAQLSVGAMYKDGVGIERNQIKAQEWFQRAARKSKAPSKRAMGDIYRDGLVVEKNIPEAMKWYKKAAEEGDPSAKAELLKLRLEASSQKDAEAVPLPANAGEARATSAAANLPAAETGIEKSREQAQLGLDETIKPGDVPARGKPLPAQKPKGARPQQEKRTRERPVKEPVPEEAGPAKKAGTRRNPLYLLSAVGLILAALAALLVGLGKKADQAWESLEMRAAEIAALPRPDPRSLPAMAVQLPGEFLKKARAAEASRRKIPAPVVEAAQAPAVVQPTAPLLRQEYKALDEAEISRMLAARNIFDAKRNPGGNFQHRYEIRNAAGLRLIVDNATGLVWARQGNAVRMNLKKSQEWIESLNRVAYGGNKKWRLPTVEEAAALLQKKPEGKKYFLDAIFGEDLTVIWTGDSSTVAESWVIDFQNGMTVQAKNRSRLLTLMVSSSAD